MKLPFQSLFVLMLFVGAPFGLMRLTSQAIQTPETYPLMTSCQSSLAIYRATRHAVRQVVMPQKLFYLAVRDRVRDSPVTAKLVSLSDQLDSQRPKRFTHVSSRSHAIPGLIASMRRAMASSWNQWQPTLVALPDSIRELLSLIRLNEWRTRANEYAEIARTLPVATRSPQPLIAPSLASLKSSHQSSVSTILLSTVKSTLPEASRLKTLLSLRMVSQVIGEIPNPSLDVTRIADGVRGWTEGARFLADLVQIGVDNR